MSKVKKKEEEIEKTAWSQTIVMKNEIYHHKPILSERT